MRDGDRELGTRLSAYELEFEDTFDADGLDGSRWLPHYLPQWSSRERAAARFDAGGGRLRLRIDHDQEPWCPALDGDVRVSSLQTGVFAGPLGSTAGQHRFHPDATVTEEQPEARLYTPHHGVVEVRLRALDDPRGMVALWMVGFEDRPERSAEICVCEIFGRDVERGRARVGMGVHPFGDPAIADDFAAVELQIDVREPHTYAVEWTPEDVTWFVDDRPVRRVGQSPAYPMQLMLGLYELPAPAPAPRRPDDYPLEAVVEHVRGWRPRR